MYQRSFGISYYDVLELQKNCTQEEIEKAYKKAALRYHPDRNPGDSECAEKFLRIQEAYDHLKDPEKRRQYDFRSNNPQAGFVPHFHEVEDLDIRISINLNFEETVLGCKKTISVVRKSPCSDCGGQGHKKFVGCHLCGGKGVIFNQLGGFFRFQQGCPNCFGKGRVGTEKCIGCNGHKFKNENETKIDVMVPGGIMHGMVVCVHGMGHIGSQGNIGNVNVQCLVNENKKYTIRGLDIGFHLDLDFSTMLFGGKVEIPTFEGDVIELDIPAKTQNLTSFRVKGKGMPNVHNKMSRGDLVATAITKIPDNDFVPELKSLLRHHGI